MRMLLRCCRTFSAWVSGLIFFLIEKDSRLVRFHAMQSILLNASAIVVGIVLWIVMGRCDASC